MTRTEKLVPIPKSIQLISQGDRVVLIRKWFSPAVFFLLPFAVIWNGFMVFWMGTAFREGQLLMMAFGSIHAAVGIGLVYFCAAMFLNKTQISIDVDHLKVSHAPLPWAGKKTLMAAEIQQLYAKERVSHNRNSTQVRYDLHAIMANGQGEPLLKGLNSSEELHYIENQIESILGIQDQEVVGEYK